LEPFLLLPLRKSQTEPRARIAAIIMMAIMITGVETGSPAIAMTALTKASIIIHPSDRRGGRATLLVSVGKCCHPI
jgi:hypothetical protein